MLARSYQQVVPGGLDAVSGIALGCTDIPSSPGRGEPVSQESTEILRERKRESLWSKSGRKRGRRIGVAGSLKETKKETILNSMNFGMRQRKEDTDAHFHPEIDALFNPGPTCLMGRRQTACIPRFWGR
jgi:hypothetical protein